MQNKKLIVIKNVFMGIYHKKTEGLNGYYAGGD